MIDALYIASSGIKSQQLYLDVISNNVSNLNTPGFKKANINFVDMARLQTMQGSRSSSSEFEDISIGAGTRIQSISHNFQAGDLKATEGQLDLAITGKGFLEVETASGELAYTRSGRLTTDEQGRLITISGYPLTSNITIPSEAKSILIQEDGEVLVSVAGEFEPVLVGEIEIAYFSSESQLAPAGSTLFVPTKESGEAYYSTAGTNGVGTIKQGFIEISNVSMISEMVELLAAQRAYQLNARVVQAADQLMETTNNLSRG